MAKNAKRYRATSMAQEAALDAQQDETLDLLRAMQQRSGELERPKGKVTKESIVDFVEYRINYDPNAPITFKHRPWQPAIYNSEYTVRRSVSGDPQFMRRTLVLSARQCEKSSMEGNKIWAMASLIPNMTILYCSSANANLLEFLDERLENTIEISPHLRARVGSLLSDTKFMKRLKGNNSKIVARSIYRSGDRARGVAADAVFFDEFQNMQPENIAVVAATTQNSPLMYGPIEIRAGTPLGFDNIAEKTWKYESTQNMWLTRCGRCRTWNPPLIEQMGVAGMICSKCGKGLNPLNGQWVRKRLDVDKAKFEGFHLSRMMMCYTVAHDPDRFKIRWKSFVQDVNNPTVEDAVIQNEVFGVSADSGAKPLKEHELRAAASDDIRMRRQLPPIILNDGSWPVYMGVDWGQGTGNSAYTIVCIGYFSSDGVFNYMYFHRYMGREADAEFVKQDILELARLNNVSQIGVDYGMSFGMLGDLQQGLENGFSKVLRINYSGTQKKVVEYDSSLHMLQFHRTRWMSRIFRLIKSGKFRYPRWSEFSGPHGPETGFASDYLAITREMSRPSSGQQPQAIYSHSAPDDSFHAGLYCYTAALYHMQMILDMHYE